MSVLVVRCPVQVLVTDAAGNESGLAASGEILSGISGSAGAILGQGADREFYLSCRPNR